MNSEVYKQGNARNIFISVIFGVLMKKGPKAGPDQTHSYLKAEYWKFEMSV